MSKQLMIYERAVPISSEKHKDWSVQMGSDYSFAAQVNAMPLLAAEFIPAASEFAIVFGGEGDAVFPAVILGVKDNTNVFVGADGTWQARYMPAFLRRYPFVFAKSQDGKTFTLCIDEEFGGFNQDGVGERLFDSKGNRTQFLESKLRFSQEYQGLFDRTQAFCRRLAELDVLEAGQARFNLPGGQSAALGGFKTINRDKLKSIPTDTLSEMLRTDELEMCYVHLLSLRNLSPIAEKLAADAAAGDGAPEPADDTPVESAPDAQVPG